MHLRYAFFILTFAAFFMCISCNTSPSQQGTCLQIVATTGMVADMVREIAGDSAEVTALMGPGVDPHLYKATQGDLRRLQDAQLIFYNGLHLEGKMGELFEKLSRLKSVIAIAEEIPSSLLLDSPKYPGTYDPHVWFDVKLWKQCIPVVLKNLIAKKPKAAQYFETRANAYSQKLDSLDLEVQTKISRIPKEQRILITAHDAFSYFGKAYDLEVKGLQGISTLSEFGLKDRIDLVDFIVDRKIPAVFIESSVPKKNIESIVEGCYQKGHEVQIGGSLYSDALGPEGSVEASYVGAFRYNVAQMVQALTPKN